MTDHGFSIMDFSMDKRKQRPYSDYDKQVLTQLVQSNIDIIKNRKSDSVTQKKKQEVWEDIANKYNKNSNVSQTADAKQLKKMWQNLKTKARAGKTAESQCKKPGTEPSEMRSLDSTVITVMPAMVPIESDPLHEAGTSYEYDTDEESWLLKEPKSEVMDTTQMKVQQIEKMEEKQEKKTVEDLNKDLLIQEIEININKASLEMEQAKQKHKLEIEFLKEKYRLELEILQLKKENLRKQINN